MDIAVDDRGDIRIDGGDIPVLTLAEFISQRIWLILRSRPGDWVQSPDKGADVNQYMGYPNVPSTKALVEREVLEELERDSILGNFNIRVEYTPTSQTDAYIEVGADLPDGELVTIREMIQSTGGIVASEYPTFTDATYDTSSQITRTELVTLISASSVFQVKHPIASDIVFIVPYADDIELDEEGHLIIESLTDTFDINVEFSVGLDSTIQDNIGPIIDQSGITSVKIDDVETDQYYVDPAEYVIYISGVCEEKVRIEAEWLNPSGETENHIQQFPTAEEQADGEVFDTQTGTFALSGEIGTILTEKLIQSVGVLADGETISNENYAYTQDIVTLDLFPTISVELTATYYDTYGIASINTISQDFHPNNVFPRVRTGNKNTVAAKNLFEAGVYFIQYLSYELEA